MKTLYLLLLGLLLNSSTSGASGTTPAELLFFDITQGFDCTVSYGRSTSNIVISEFVDFEHRILYFIGNSGEVRGSQKAKCDFDEENYVCRWGKTRSIEINLFHVTKSELAAKKTAHLNGEARLDIFRPSVRISCPLEIKGQITE